MANRFCSPPAARAALTFALAALAPIMPTGAQAQSYRIDSQTTFVLPGEIEDCTAPQVQAGGGLIEQSANCPARGGITRYEITIVTGGGHLNEPERRLGAALERADIPKAELPKRIERREIKTRGKALKLVCVATVYDDGQNDVTCVRDERLARMEFVTEAPTVDKAWELMRLIVAESDLK